MKFFILGRSFVSIEQNKKLAERKIDVTKISHNQNYNNKTLVFRSLHGVDVNFTDISELKHDSTDGNENKNWPF